MDEIGILLITWFYRKSESKSVADIFSTVMCRLWLQDLQCTSGSGATVCGDLRLCVRRQGSGGYRCRGPGSVFDFQILCLNKYFGVGARIRRPIINTLILFFMFLVQQQRHRKFINQQFCNLKMKILKKVIILIVTLLTFKYWKLPIRNDVTTFIHIFV